MIRSSRCLLPLLAVVALGAAETAPPPVAPPAAAAAQVAPRPMLGMTVEDSAAGDAPGLAVAEVKAFHTAATLGLEPGDRILSLNGKPVKITGDIQKILAGSKVGDPIKIDFTRAGNPMTANGTMMAKPNQDLSGEVAKIQQQIETVRAQASSKAKEPSLSEILQQVKDIEAGLPKAVAAFKRQYPDGTFEIHVSITISTDKNAKAPLEFSNSKDAAAAPESERKPDADKKPDEAKRDESAKDVAAPK